ncbi:Fis family transcriptional regulator, partial [Anaeromyxobacter sp. Red801]|uniref:Fis family transcriptional regulator n=1 Tax=Anaeromyxobacter sp. Red801 TaxID=3411632 RepID=UPI003BA3BEBE
MADLDDELLERVARWCAEAGRQAGTAEIRRALGALGWDELLMVKALLADPPPARPLGPQALADLARGTPAEIAAERERGGMYRRDEEPQAAAPGAAAPARAPAAPPRRKGAARKAKLVVRRARDRAAAPEPAPAPSLPLLDELQLPAGRAELERLVRRLGARRPAILAALAAGWRRADGAPASDADLGALLELHGLAHAFARRERDELLHAVRAAGGVLSRAAEGLGLDAAGLRAALARAGAEREAERVRDERRAELRARATLTERVRLLLADEPRLADLGLLPEFEADLRARLPEHLRALRASGGPLRPALGASLSLDRAGVDALGARLGLELGPAAGSSPAEWPAPARRPARPERGGRGPRPAGGERTPRRRTPGAGRPPDRGGRP